MIGSGDGHWLVGGALGGSDDGRGSVALVGRGHGDGDAFLSRDNG